LSVGANREKLLKTIRLSYARAPQFEHAFAVIEEVLGNPETNLAKFLTNGLQRVSEYLQLRPQWCLSSAIRGHGHLRGQERILAICEQLGARSYINLPGGESLYDRDSFGRKDIKLSFVKPNAVCYPQFDNDFVPNLSIIDVMMFNDQDRCAQLLKEYRLD
jgi:hypothetical protein